MSDNVNARRAYRAPQRTARAAATRRAVLDGARVLFVERGYAATTVADIAERAGVAVDTLYATVGRKPEILRELVETAISGTGEVVPAEQREYVLAIQAAPDVETKVVLYAAAVTAIQSRFAPIFLALRDAAVADTSCAALWHEIAERRARNMRRFAAELRATGRLRDDLTDDDVADVIWTMNAAEYWDLLVGQRGWSPERFRDWLADAWTRLLLAPGSASQPSD
jgi:AcrR family transcriptional regulator